MAKDKFAAFADSTTQETISSAKLVENKPKEKVDEVKNPYCSFPMTVFPTTLRDAIKTKKPKEPVNAFLKRAAIKLAIEEGFFDLTELPD